MRKLERKYSRELAVVGVHSPKFVADQDTESVRQANGRLYVADTNSHAIRVVDLERGEVTTLALSGLAAGAPPAR